MDSPWIKFATPDTNREYFALLSYLPLNKYRAIPAFLNFTFQIQKQLRSTPGIIGYSLRAKPLSRNFWTLSGWTDEKALMDFVTKIPHSQAMKAMTPHMGPTNFTKWKVSGSALPLRWEDAMKRAQKGGTS
jgi:quinol monooxygenase YgiN